jgi:hypothetical protein
MKNAPERLRGFCGAAKASGDMEKSAVHFSSLLRLTRNAGSDRAEIGETIREASGTIPS